MVLADASVGRGAALDDERPRVERPPANPVREVGNLLVGKLVALRGHLEVRVLVADGVDDEAVLGLARDDRWPRVAAVEHALAGVQHEAALYLVGVAAVAFVATVREHGTDVRLKKLEVLRRNRRRGSRRRDIRLQPRTQDAEAQREQQRDALALS